MGTRGKKRTLNIIPIHIHSCVDDDDAVDGDVEEKRDELVR